MNREVIFPPDWSIAQAEEIRQMLIASLEAQLDVVWDFSGVRVCDTAGIQLICAATRTARERGQRVRIAAVSAAITETMAALGVRVEGVGHGV